MLATPLLAALAAAVVLALVHVATPALRFLDGTPRSVWLSVAGGVSVAYVFVHLLPELAEGERQLSEALGGGAEGEVIPGLGFAERHVYLVALVGLATFYGLERLAQSSRSRTTGQAVAPGRASADAEGGAESTSAGVFWVHMASFAVYNALVGYLLLDGERETASTLAPFAIAMALHFVVTDYGLNEHHQARYRRVGRWVLAAAVFVGLGVATAAELPQAAIAVLVAFLGGGVILNVLKEEVPSERQSRFWAFAAGMAGYAVLLLAI